MKKITTIFLAVVALLTSCEKSPIESNTPEEAREAIELSLGALIVDQMGAGTAEAAQQEEETISLTKSSLSTEPSTTIKNLWVLQFSNQGALLGTPEYLDKFDERKESEKLVKLIPTGTEEGSESTIVYLANTFNSKLVQLLGNNYTIDDVKALSHPITTDEGSNFITADKEGNVITDKDSKEPKYMIMYGTIEQSITSDAILKECKLKRTVAKITVTIVENKTDLKFLRAEINGIPNKSYYFPTLDVTEEHPAKGTFHAIDYPAEELEGRTSFTFYVPTNRRGVENNYSPLTKNHLGSHNKTSVNIIAQDDNDVYCYTFFLGANLINDFNIDCDKEYKYNLTFKSKGDPNYDDRVTILNHTDYTEETTPLSNCYILNPSDITEQIIYIPIDRIDEFWSSKNKYAESGIYAGKNTIASVNGNWEAVLMWHDSDDYTLDGEGDAQNLGGLKVEKSISPSNKPCVKVTLPQHYKHCNVGFVVRRTDEKYKGLILWSWHLWITDYKPYPKGLLPSLSIKSYDVDGGALHRYNSPAFMGGIYSDKFIMDRNIGARSADFEGHGAVTDKTTGSAGSLYYQFGRKDPFPSNATYLNDYVYTTDKDATKEQTFEYSVNNPEKFIINSKGNWCINDNGKSTSYIWNDYNIKVEGYISGKSIFDPSPLGFRLPLSDTWSDFTGGNESDETGSPDKYTFIWTRYLSTALEEYDYGRLYNGIAYYPASGYRIYNNSNGNVGFNGRNGYSWSANPSSENSGYSLGFGATFLKPDLAAMRANGYTVRPIQE